MPGQTIEIVARQFCHVILLTVALESQHGPPQCFASLYAADTWDNKAAPPGEMIGPWRVNRASLPCAIRMAALSNSLSPIGASGRAVIAAVCPRGSATRWSILLTIESLAGSLQSAVAASLFERRDCWAQTMPTSGLFALVYFYPGLAIEPLIPTSRCM
jgi:hypothetical protein